MNKLLYPYLTITNTSIMKVLHESLDVKWKSHDFGKTTLFMDSGLCNFMIMQIIKPPKPLRFDGFDFGMITEERNISRLINTARENSMINTIVEKSEE